MQVNLENDCIMLSSDGAVQNRASSGGKGRDSQHIQQEQAGLEEMRQNLIWPIHSVCWKSLWQN